MRYKTSLCIIAAGLMVCGSPSPVIATDQLSIAVGTLWKPWAVWEPALRTW